MTDVSRIVNQIGQGDPNASERLLPLVYDELRKLAAAKLAHEKPGQTLQATALVHEAYLRLVGTSQEQHWENRGHFFAAAAEAMRRILVEGARRRKRLKRGGEMERVDLDQVLLVSKLPADEVLSVHEALSRLECEDPSAAQLVKLRYFAGFSLTEAAQAIGISRSNAYEQWAYARAWLRCAVEGDEPLSTT